MAAASIWRAPDGTVIKVFRHDPHDPTSLPSNTVYALDGRRARTGSGSEPTAAASRRSIGSTALPETIRFKVVRARRTVERHDLRGAERCQGRLWLSGNAGLMRFDPDTRRGQDLSSRDGLQGEEFDSGAYFRLRDGRLCFGGPGGFNIFDPSRLTERMHHAPRVALTHLEVLGVPVPSATPYWLLDRIVVDYRANIVSLDFGALDFISPKRNRLAYRMTGLTDRWIDLGTQHRITLTNLDAGDHMLEVRAANSDSVWSDRRCA